MLLILISNFTGPATVTIQLTAQSKVAFSLGDPTTSIGLTTPGDPPVLQFVVRTSQLYLAFGPPSGTNLMVEVGVPIAADAGTQSFSLTATGAGNLTVQAGLVGTNLVTLGSAPTVIPWS